MKIRISESQYKNLYSLLSEAYEHTRDEIVDFDKIDLQHEYNKLNKLLFNDELPHVPIMWNRAKNAHGMVQVTYNRVTGVRKVKAMKLSTFYAVPYHIFLDTLAHEMIHVWQAKHGIREANGNHGYKFHEQMDRINSMGLGFKVSVKLDSHGLGLGVSDRVKARAKPTIVLLMDLDGKHGAAVITQNAYDVQGAKIGDIYEYQTKKGKYKKVEGYFYRVEMPEALLLPSNRSLNNLRYNLITPQEFEKYKGGELLAHFVTMNGQTNWDGPDIPTNRQDISRKPKSRGFDDIFGGFKF